MMCGLFAVFALALQDAGGPVFITFLIGTGLCFLADLLGCALSFRAYIGKRR